MMQFRRLSIRIPPIFRYARGCARGCRPGRILGLLLILIFAGCDRGERPGSSATGAVKEPEPADIHSAEFRKIVFEFCGQCHAYPDPESLPRHRWAAEVDRAFDFYRRRIGRIAENVRVPREEDVIAYYEANSPEQLVFDVPAWRLEPDSPFIEVAAHPDDLRSEQVTISHLLWWREADGSQPKLLACDMRSGDILAYRWNDGRFERDVLATVAFPAHIEPCDLDGDGRHDFVVAALGSLFAEDHDRGQVVWLRRDGEAGRYTAVPLLSGVGRVADVRPADFDGDGRTDLVVAEFGWLTTGGLHLLMQTGLDERGVPQFRQEKLDFRHGWSHVPVGDLNGDGRPDFVGLVSQEFESVVAFLNRGGGRFEQQIVFEANDAGYGSSGIELVDLDGDGDLDVLMTNGDHFDGYFLSPRHSAAWLENVGAFPFERHELGRVPGIYRAVAADFTGDGLLDVAAISSIPVGTWSQPPEARRQTIVWYEQTRPREFVERVVQRDNSSAGVALEAADVDGDGWIDLLTGPFDVDEAEDPDRGSHTEPRASRMPGVRFYRNSGGAR